MCDLHLRDEIHRDDKGKLHKYYRLHARKAHTEKQAFAYDIKCPHCYSMLKQVARQETYTELGLYTCPSCNRYFGKEVICMPVISMFYGIIVRMYREVNGKHNMPHLHAEYSGEEIVIALDGTILEGAIAKNISKLSH